MRLLTECAWSQRNSLPNTERYLLLIHTRPAIKAVVLPSIIYCTIVPLIYVAVIIGHNRHFCLLYVDRNLTSFLKNK